jgi:hypothetical protein
LTEFGVWIWLMAKFRRTGNKVFREAADALEVPLVAKLTKRLGRRGLSATGIEDRPRLRRMARAIMAGTSMRAAARQEVAAHGRGKHTTPEAAVDRLRRQYRERRQDIEELVIELDSWAANERARREQFDRFVHPYNTLTTELDRWGANERARREQFDRFVHYIEHLATGGANTRTEKKPQDKR